jgi:RHS repeat-associated protein
MVVRRNGWIYVYLSNQSNQDVFFDNLVVNLKHGPLVEQKVYYAFGIENPALSTQAIKQPYNQNRYKFNGIEYDTAFGLDYYEARFRDYDPQIGRFTQIDPKVESTEGWSVYSAMLNNPVKNIDPLGDSSKIGDWLDAHNIGFREPTSEQWQNHPVQSAVSEAGYAIANFFGLTTLEQTLRIVSDTKASTSDKLMSVVAAGLAMTRGEHGSGEHTTSAKGSEITVGEIPKPLKGKGTVSPSERDPKRLFTKEEKASMLEQQNGKCPQCGEVKTVDEVEGHHVKRHADGGSTTTQNGASVCKNCHVNLHG